MTGFVILKEIVFILAMTITIMDTYMHRCSNLMYLWIH
jgi:hypothetical protein